MCSELDTKQGPRKHLSSVRCNPTRTELHLVDVVLDVQGLKVARLGPGDVLSLAGFRVGLGPGEEGLLSGLDILLLAVPRLEGGGLVGAAKGKGHGPGSDTVDAVDGVEEDAGVLLGEAATEEGDAGHGGRDGSLQGLDGQAGDVRGGRLLGAVDASHCHGGLEQGPLEQDAALLQLLVGDGHDALLDGGGGLNVVDPVDEDLGLDDGDEAGLLADAGVAGQAVRGFVDGVVRGAVVRHVDAEGRAPLGEPGPAGVVGDALVVEAVEAAAPGLALVAPHEGLEAGVDLDAGDDARRLEQVREGGAVGSVLVERLLEEDGAGDEVAQLGRAEQQFAPLGESG